MLFRSFILFILAFLVIDPAFLIILTVIFAFVTIHEVSHSVVSMKHDINVKRILLLPIGGMAMMDTTDMSPWTEIKMAIAGPITNFVAAGVFLLIGTALGLPLFEWVSAFLSNPESFNLSLANILVFYSFYANLILGTFNLLIPAFPLDGGRIFRALLAMKYPYIRATEIAKMVSYIISAMLFLLGVLSLTAGGGGLWIMVIAVFIAFGATGEYKGLVVHSSLAKIDTNEVMSREFPAANSGESIRQAVNRAVMFKKRNVIVVDEEVKIIDMDKLKKIDKDKWIETPVKEVMDNVRPFTLESSPEDIFKYMNNTGKNLVPIIQEDRKSVV